MAKIFISMAGEGRGHATRVRALTEGLRGEHELVLYAPGDAWSLLAPLYADTDVEARELPGLRFKYGRDQRVSYASTAGGALQWIAGMPRLLRQLERALEDEQPDLVVTDFEPALPRAARRVGVPFVSVTHQHFLVHGDFSDLPRPLQRHARWMGRVVRQYYSGQVATVVSGFQLPPLRPKGRHPIVPVGVLLRPSVRRARPSVAGHFVAYLRRTMPVNVLHALQALPGEVRIYGLGERPRDTNLVFRPVSESGFIEDLASARALVSTAGNQLVGEALYLNKPVFAMPEPGNHEQTINAHFLARTGHGAWASAEEVHPHHLATFVDQLEGLRPGPASARFDGMPETLRVLQRYLPAPAFVAAGSARWSPEKARSA